MKRILARSLVLAAIAGAAAPALGQTMFTATLDGAQENPPVASGASGTATLELNAHQDRLSYTITLTGLDLDGLQTPADPTDDVTAMHFHNAPVGVNGPVVFGLISPGQDADDIVIDPVHGTISGAWEETDPANAALSTQLAGLLAGDLYLNVHTTTNPAGEVRGQVLPASVPAMPSLGLAVLLLLLVSAGVLLLRR